MVKKRRSTYVIECAVCRKPKWEEKDPEKDPGLYVRVRRAGYCRCRSGPEEAEVHLNEEAP